MRSARPQPQDELALSSVLAHALFPGRSTLYVAEVARALHCTQQHVLDLILEGRLKAVNIAGDKITGGNQSDRKHWRIPVSAFDQFVTENQST